MKTIELHHKQFRCEFAPNLGGSLIGLWCDGEPILKHTPRDTLSSALEAASYPLVPYSNRIENGDLKWKNKNFKLSPNFPREPHTIHGVGWQERWEIQELEKSSVSLVLNHHKNAAWPWTFSATQTLCLLDEGLLATLSVRNLDQTSMPTGLGWHPYFSKRADMHIAFQCQGRWEMDENSLPNYRTNMEKFHTACEDLAIDHCHDGWHGIVDLTDPIFEISIASSLKHLVVYSVPQSDMIAIEPVSHLNNALRMIDRKQITLEESGIVVLAPEANFSNQMMINIRRRL